MKPAPTPTLPDYRSQSLWLDTVPDALQPRPSLEQELEVDLAIVGAGYTGLWTAYYLSTLEPALRIAIVESEIAGFGASGRNGGWVLGESMGIEDYFAAPDQRKRGIALQRALFDAVDEVGRISQAEGIDCHYTKGGTLAVATVEPHRRQLQERLNELRGLGFGSDDYRWLEPAECRARIHTQQNLGGVYSPHCAAIHPARLARGLADRVEARGTRIFERSPAIAIEPRAVVTPRGRLRADLVLVATEGYTRDLPGRRRQLLPVHSMMIATEPLSDVVWKEIGLRERETFADPRRTVIYGQRTVDGRIAFGGRGSYFLGSRYRNRFPADHLRFRQVRTALVSLFPVLRDARITHRWGGPLGVARDWRVSVGLDRKAGLAWGGGYAGEGVCASNLVGRTLADLILERDSEYARLCLVRPPFQNWEPEPMRWLAVHGSMQLGGQIDRAELAGRTSPRWQRALHRWLVGR